MKALYTLLFLFSFTTAFTQSTNEAIDDLGISSKGKFALSVKPGTSYGKVVTLPAKNKKGNLFYDDVANVFSVVFDESGSNYAQISYQVKDQNVVGCTVECYLTSSAKIDDISKRITKILDKNYTRHGEDFWEGKGLHIEFFKSPDGFNIAYSLKK